MGYLKNNIKRYWCKSYNNILDCTGFLENPERQYFYKGDNIIELQDITENACIFLTNIIGEAFDSFVNYYQQEKINHKNDFYYYYNLSNYCSESRLINDVFNASLFSEWENSDKDIRIFIDGFDRCVKQIPSIAQILITEIEKSDQFKKRFYIRICTSSGLWDIDLENFFSAFWGEENFIRLSIAPLRQEDVSIICQENNISSNEFLDILTNNELQPIAINLITLNYLLRADINKLYNEDLSVDELYYNSCLILCEESVRKGQITDSISPDKMIAIASRIAAIMVFCRKRFVSTYRLVGEARNTLFISEIFEEDETTGEYSFCISYKDILHTLQLSGLFYKSSDGRFSFYHPSFQDYLAAKFIVNHEYDIDKTISLLTNSKDKEGKLFEWVRGTYAWMQNISPKIDILKYFISHDPLKVLNGRIVNDNDLKEELVKTILEKFDKAEIIDEEVGLLSKNGDKLYHSKIVEQISPYISGKEKHILARRNAMEIAEACNLVELQDVLWKVVSDNTETIHIREQAMSSLSKIVKDEKILSTMVEMATTENENDENDGLKGYALNITWSRKIISTEQIFKSLTKPKKSNFLGMYKMFIEYILSKELKIKDIGVALTWVKNNINKVDYTITPFHHLISSILWIGWRNYEALKDKELFTETIQLILKQHQSIFPKQESTFDKQDDIDYNIPKEIRFDVIDRLLSKYSKEQFYFFEFFSSHLILHEEFESAVYHCKRAQNIELWKKILLGFSYENETRKELIKTSFPEDVDTIFRSILSPEMINNEKEKEEKAQQEKSAKAEEKAAKTIKNKLINCISEFEATKDPAWWTYFFRLLGTRYYNGHYFEEVLSSDVTHLDNWELLTPEQHNIVISLSKYYIENFNEDHESWFGKKLYSYLASAGFKSLILIDFFDDNYIKNLDKSIIENWRYIIINYGENSGTKEHQDRKEKLIKLLFEKNSNKASEVIRKKILLENQSEQSYLFSLHPLELFFDKHSDDMLFDLLSSENLTNESQKQIVSLLLDKSPIKAFAYVKSVIEKTIDIELRRHFLTVLLANNDDYSENKQFWEFVYQNISNDNTLETDCYLSLAIIYRTVKNKSIYNILNENHISFLYERLYNIFPPDEDPKYEGVHYIGAREEVAFLRDNLLRILTDKGTKESVEELQRLKDFLPNAGIEFSIIKAKDNFRNTDFNRISPADFQRLSRNGQFRIVSNGEDLLSIIEESLVRLEHILQGSQPLSSSLWNINKLDEGNKYSTKNEEYLSDYIASHFRQDLEKYVITPYREVQLRCKKLIPNGKQGENIDILIDCNLRGKKVNVIIEIKGSWNEEIPTNMQNQLYNRYMKTDNCNYGLYLIGWYNCSYDHRNKTNCTSLEEAKEHYEQKAKELSKTNNVCIKSFVLDCRLQKGLSKTLCKWKTDRI